MCTLLLETFLSRNGQIFPLILFFFLKNVGMFMVTSLEANMSCTLNPLSAIKLSTRIYTYLFKSLLSTIWRSLVDPQYAGLMKLTRPPGVHPINDFMVFLFLYVEKVACCALGETWFLYWKLGSIQNCTGCRKLQFENPRGEKMIH